MSELLQQELDAISVSKKNMYICMTLSGSIKIESIFKKLTEIGATSFLGRGCENTKLKKSWHFEGGFHVCRLFLSTVNLSK